MTIYLGADHRGYAYKEMVKKWLTDWGKEYEDLGAHEPNIDDDYPDIARAVAGKIQPGDLGILICGSGIGVSIVANRIQGIRCGVGLSEAQVRAGRNDDDTNVLALASDFIDVQTAEQMVKAFVTTSFSSDERFRRRINKIDSA